jgi:hypothetical protein
MRLRLVPNCLEVPVRAAKIALIAVALSPAVVFAQVQRLPVDAPTLDEVGLFALISLIGGVGAYFARKYKK